MYPAETNPPLTDNLKRYYSRLSGGLIYLIHPLIKLIDAHSITCALSWSGGHYTSIQPIPETKDIHTL